MPRPVKRRLVCGQPGARLFKPAGAPWLGLACQELTLDELEALRLCDLAGLHQSAAAEVMGVSRATLGRIVTAARAKVAAALVEGQALRIGGGPVELSRRGCRCGHCRTHRAGLEHNQGVTHGSSKHGKR